MINGFVLNFVEDWNFRFSGWQICLLLLLVIYEKVKAASIQESIPVGCVPPASVATTRCQHWGVYLPGVYLPSFLPGRDLGPGIPTLRRDLGPGISTPTTWTEWLTDICENFIFPQLRWRSVKIDTRVIAGNQIDISRTSLKCVIYGVE